MFRKSLAIFISVAFAIPLAAAPGAPSTQRKLSATDIANKNVTARGGLQAWRAVQALSFLGKLGAGGNQPDTTPAVVPAGRKGSIQPIVSDRPTQEVQLPFVMELARPRKMRFELQFNGQTAVQVFDGINGWKLRPFLGRHEVEPYTLDEMKTASGQAELDGPLVDYAAKGTQIELVGMEKVEDRDTYKLKLTAKSGVTTNVWVDAQTFLETKIEGVPRQMDGKIHSVEIYMRDYRSINGLMVPYVLETTVQGGAKSHKMTIQTVQVNPKLQDSLFTKPSAGNQ